jgi:hypothetical protein
VVAGGIHPAGQGTHVVDTRRVGQEREHDVEPTDDQRWVRTVR